ncbi:hypothetical protein GCM10027411_22820 [Microbacterium aureliae]
MPIWTRPSWIWKAPNQITATLETFSTSITAGNISAIRFPARSAADITSPLAAANRARSWSSRTKARTTRMPASCSRMTWLTRSIRCCIRAKAGTMRQTISPTITSRTGMVTAISHASPAS